MQMVKFASSLIHPLLQSVMYQISHGPITLPCFRQIYQHVSIPPICSESSGSLSGMHMLLSTISFEVMAMGYVMPPAIFLAFSPCELNGSPVFFTRLVRYSLSQRSEIERKNEQEERETSPFQEIYRLKKSGSLACFVGVNESSVSGERRNGILALSLLIDCINEFMGAVREKTRKDITPAWIYSANAAKTNMGGSAGDHKEYQDCRTLPELP